MNKFNDGAPRTVKEWHDLSFKTIPCTVDGIPIQKGWQEDDYKSNIIPMEFYKSKVWGVRLDNLVDLDIDNPIMQQFLGEIICGAKFGRKSNPLSHLLFEGVTEYEQIAVPKAFEKYFKSFPHGRVLLDIRHGQNHFTYVPCGLRPHKQNAGSEVLDWLHFTGFMKYDTRINKQMKEICLKTALSVMFPAKGQRNVFINSIGGILAKHTDWTEEHINQFCFDLALKSGHESPTEFVSVGTRARDEKNKTFGIPKLAEILEVDVSDVSKLFAWVGVKDASSMFSELVVYNTEPKQWKLKFKDKWIDIWDTSILLSYTKIKILILENCMEEPPEIKPNDWKVIRMQLLKNVKKEEVPPESSYYGMIGSEICNLLVNRSKKSDDELEDLRYNLASQFGKAKYQGYYWFRLDAVINYLKLSKISFEIRKLTHFLKNDFGAEPTKVTVDKREIRAWKVAAENIEGSKHHQTDDEALVTGFYENKDKKEKRLGRSIYGKSKNY